MEGKRSDSPEPSCVSMRSNQSMGNPLELRKEKHTTEIRSDSPEPSCVSMRSNQSMGNPLELRKEKHVTEIRLDSLEPSCVSMKSDQSITMELNLRKEKHTHEIRPQKKKAKETKETPQLTFKVLEDKAVALLRKELKKLKTLFNPDYPVQSESEVEDDELEEEVDDLRDGVRKITLHILRAMNQTVLINKLEKHCLPAAIEDYKSRLYEKCKRICEGNSDPGTAVLLNEVYTDLYITEGGSGEVNNEHEVRQIELTFRRQVTPETAIKCNDLFNENSIRTVLTKGIAGIGKTVSVQKFIVDWTEGKANQDLKFIFPLPFRELNLKKHMKFSLVGLLHHLFPEIKKLKPKHLNLYRILFIFDGLDECRLSLDFQNNPIVSDVTEATTVDVLLTNLIMGNLLPSALLWITTRPAAANQIPPEYIHQVTEVRGFNNPQKEEYLKKRISNKDLANKIISHIRSSRTLHVMCHIPVFCWISASVLKRMLSNAESGVIPKTLTQMFIHFLVFQIKNSTQKYEGKMEIDPKQTTDVIMALGRLAYEQLDKGNLIFYEEDVRQCGLKVKDVSLYSGVCTQIFREDCGMQPGKVFSFVHLSVQEFLAAFYVLLCKRNKSKQLPGIPKTDLLECAVDEALQNQNGHLDLFLRFLLGLSVEVKQNSLRNILIQKASVSYNKKKIVMYIKKKINENLSPEKIINLFHCLNELNDHSLKQEVQKYLNRGVGGARLSPAQWSALAFVLVNSEKELEEFDLRKIKKSDEGLERLLPVVKVAKKAVLCECNLLEDSCVHLSSVLRLNSSSLIELDLSYNKLLMDAGMKNLCDGLKHPDCKLQILRMQCCGITETGCAEVVSALRSNPSSELRKLNLNYNKTGDAGVKHLSVLLQDPQTNLQKLQLQWCGITDDGFISLASALKSNSSSRLDHLNLNYNKAGESGVYQFSDLLKNPDCNLKTLQLQCCSITNEGCDVLVSACSSQTTLNLNLNKTGDLGVVADRTRDQLSKLDHIQMQDLSHLMNLDLNRNPIGDLGVKLLSELLKDPLCNLQKLQLRGCSLSGESCLVLSSVLGSDSCKLKELDLSFNILEDLGVKDLCTGLKHSECKLKILRLRGCNLTAESFIGLLSVLSSSGLIELNLSKNNLQDLKLKDFTAGSKHPDCNLQILRLRGCSLTEEGCKVLSVILSSYNLTELDLSKNELYDLGIIKLSAGLLDPKCNLQKLRLYWCNLSGESCSVLSSVLKSKSSSLKELDLSKNKLQDAGVKILSEALKDPNCNLEILWLECCDFTDEGRKTLKSALKSNPESQLKQLHQGNKAPEGSTQNLQKRK